MDSISKSHVWFFKSRNSGVHKKDINRCGRPLETQHPTPPPPKKTNKQKKPNKQKKNNSTRQLFKKNKTNAEEEHDGVRILPYLMRKGLSHTHSHSTSLASFFSVCLLFPSSLHLYWPPFGLKQVHRKPTEQKEKPATQAVWII